MTLRILNVNDTIDLKIGGGTAERTFQMSRHLAKQGATCTVLTLDSEFIDEQRVAALKPAKIEVVPCLWRRFNFPGISWIRISRLVKESDVIHLMGHWSILNALVYFAARQASKPYVICPAGALPLFGRSVRLKRLYNFLVGKNIVRNASGWIAVTKGEFADFETYGILPQRITVIPNGVSKEDFPLVDTVEFKRRYGLPDAPIILFMGRLNLIKGPDLLLQAYIRARNTLPKYHLVFAGPDGGMLPQLRELVEREGVKEWVHFLGYVGGADKSAAYRMAQLLVVPSRKEAMSIVAIEAGICGVPVLLTDQCGFEEIRSVDAGLEVPANVTGIANGLVNLLHDSANLAIIAVAWTNYVNQKYSWWSLIPEYVQFYQNILEQKGGADAKNGDSCLP